MAVEIVGGIAYDVSLDLGKMIADQRRVDAELKRTAGSLDQFGAKLNIVANAVKVYVAAQALMKVATLADDMRLLAARVQVAAGSITAGADAMRALVDISRRTQTSVTANADVFARLNQSLLAMGGTQADTLQITELLGKAVKVSGASATESSAAMLQFGQALGSGKLAGDELRSLLETAPYLMRQLADGLGVPVGKLKELGEQGKLTAGVVVNALGKAAGQIEKDFQQLPKTFMAAFGSAGDAAGRAAEKLDDMLGISALLAGVAEGVGTVFDALAKSLGAVSGESDKLGRNNAIKVWADATVTVLSYIADGADLVIRSFKAIGITIGAAAASAKEFFSGNIAGSVAIAKANQEDLAAIRAPKLAGVALRDQMASSGIPSKRGKLSGGGGDGGDTKGAKFDSEGYLAGLKAETLKGLEAVNAAEAEALRRNDKLLAEGRISVKTHAEAVTAIERAAADKRLDIQLAWAEENRQAIEDGGKEAADAERKAAEDRKAAQDAAMQLIVGEDPIAQLQYRLQTQTQVLVDAAARDQANAELYAQAKLALEKSTADQMAAIRRKEITDQAQLEAYSVSMMAQTAADVYDVLSKSGKERSALAKSLFLASKALAVAEIILNTEVAAAKAQVQLGIFGIPLATYIRATGYASAALVAGMAVGNVVAGREFGGPVSSGSLYRVGEGNKPEMFVGSSGKQYMIPGESGKVISNGDLGGAGGGWTININNAPPGTTATVNNEAKIIEVAVAQAVAQVNDSIASNSGSTWNAMRGSTNVAPRLS